MFQIINIIWDNQGLLFYSACEMNYNRFTYLKIGKNTTYTEMTAANRSGLYYEKSGV